MNIGELKEEIKFLDDNIELVGDKSGSQGDIWCVRFGRIDDVGIYIPIDNIKDIPIQEINLMICVD